MKIDKRLNLVLPILRADGSKIYLHSTPISAETFDAFFMPIAKSYAAIFQHGLGVVGGPRVAHKILRHISKELGMWEGSDGVEQGLIAEIRRLSNVLVPGPRGWETFTLDDAITRSHIERGDTDEIEGALCFFTVVSATHQRKDLHAVLEAAMSLWGARIELSSFTEFRTSLPTSTAPGSSGETVGESSQISSTGSAAPGSRHSSGGSTSGAQRQNSASVT